MSELYIFCDASIDTSRKIACAGTILIKPTPENKNYFIDDIIKGIYYIQDAATNNSGEIMAIRNGIQYGIEYSRDLLFRTNEWIDTINIFSDSKISLFGLREWSFKWVNNMNQYGVLYGSDPKNPVSNQAEFKNIIRMITDFAGYYDKIRFFHQRGHVKIQDYTNNECISEFCEENYMKGISELSLDYPSICGANNIVDNISRNILKMYIEEKSRSVMKQPEFIIPRVQERLYSQSYNTLVYYDYTSPIRYQINKDYMELYKDKLTPGTFNGGC